MGPITALAYALTLENPQRFAKSRDVGPYLGLVPKQEDSGESQPQLGISKAGDTMVRKLLVGSALAAGASAIVCKSDAAAVLIAKARELLDEIAA